MKKVCFAILCMWIFLCIGCKISASKSSFNSQIDIIDSLMQSGNYASCKKLLKEAEKAVVTSTNVLSIVKRYYQLNMNKNASDLLQKSQKHFPLDKTLAAVYLNQLLKTGDLENAMELCGILKDSVYESFVAELMLKSIQDKTSEQLLPYYEIAGKATKNNQFLINGAVILAKSGKYEEALELHPQEISQYDNTYFWASLAYDSSDYMRAIRDIDSGSYNMEGQLLKADSYIQMKEYNQSRQVWTELAINQDEINETLYVNAARSEYILGNYENTKLLLLKLVENFPDYVPGLVFYGQFAYETTMTRKTDDDLGKALRSAGFKSLEMQNNDALPMIPVSDALHKMDSFVQRNKNRVELFGNDKLQYYELMVERQKLQWLYDNENDKDRKMVDIWAMLEFCSGDNQPFPPYLVKYATWFFINNDDYSNAEKLLFNHLERSYSITADSILDADISYECESFSNWEKEMLAFLLGNVYKKYDLSQLLYESVLKDEKTIELMLNLASIYEAKAMYGRALELYADCDRKCKSDEEKSDIHYRIAELQFAEDKIEDAKISLNYSITLNPGNTKSRLLLKKISY